MFEKIKNLLTRSDDKKLQEAEKEFDELMEAVERDVKDLTQIERSVQEEFGRLGGEVKNIEVVVDELLRR